MGKISSIFKKCTVKDVVIFSFAVVGILILLNLQAEENIIKNELTAKTLATTPFSIEDGNAALVCLNGRLFAVVAGKRGSIGVTQVFRAGYNGIPERCQHSLPEGRSLSLTK